MTNWSQLPRDLLLLIGKCLETQFDVLHFRSVCTNWRASVPFNLRRQSFGPPLHFHTDKLGSKFFLSKRTVCLFESPLENSHTTPRFWLGMLEDDGSGKKRILDPLFWGKRLPAKYPLVLDISKFHVQELGRLYMQVIYFGHDHPSYGYSKRGLVPYLNGDDDDFIVMGEFHDRLMHCFKFGDKILTKIEGITSYSACIQFECKFYIVEESGNTFCVDPFTGDSFMVEKSKSEEPSCYTGLIQLCDKLLLVEMFHKLPTFSFEVFQLDEERKRWGRLESLGDGVLFFGSYGHFSAAAIPGVKGNCIIFAHAFRQVTKDENSGVAPEKLVFDISTGMTLPLDHRRDLLQLFRPSSFL